MHRGVLAQSSTLVSKCNRSDGTETLRLPEVQPQLFVLLLTYLYKRDYQNSLSAESGEDKYGNDAAAQFKTHANLYCLASAYKLDHLVEETIKKMEAVGRIEFRSLVGIAREVYPNTQGDDVWFKNYFKNEVTRALTEVPGIVEDQCILDIYKNDGGSLAVDLFTTITSHYANHGAKVDKIVAESRTPIESVPNMDNVIRCESRVHHLKKKRAWETCRACSRERDQMIAVGNAVVSVAINDLLPTMYSKYAADQITSAAAETLAKSRKKKVQKALTALATKIVKITSTVFGHSLNDCTSQCPNQAEHLRKRGGRWQWEDCTRCLEDRGRILHELQLLDFSQSLGAIPNQQSQEQSIPLHSEERIVPVIAVDATTMEIGPAKAGFPRDDAQATDALETHPTVSKCSLFPTLREVIPDSAVNYPSQEIDPPDLDSRDVTVLPSDALASHPLDINCSPGLDQQACSSQAFRTEEAGVVESLHATDSLIIFEESPSLPETKAVKKKDRKGKKAMKGMKAKESMSNRRTDVSIPEALDPKPQPPVPEASDVGYCDLVTAQHPTWDSNPAEVPRMPAVIGTYSEATPNVDFQLVDTGFGSTEQNLADSWGTWASRTAVKKGKKQKKSAFATPTFEVSEDPVPAPEEQEPNKSDKWLFSLNKLPQPAEQSQDVDIEWYTPGYKKKEKTKKKYISGWEISAPEEPRKYFWDDVSGLAREMEKPRDPEIQKDDLDVVEECPKRKKQSKSKEQETQDDDPGFWGTSKKKTNSKSHNLELSSDDVWDTWGASKKKKVTLDKEAATKKPDFWDFSLTTNAESKSSTTHAEPPEEETPARAETPPPETLWDQPVRAASADLSDPWPELEPLPAEPEAEPEPSVSSCPFRLSHLVDESKWIHCTPCRRELKFIARLALKASQRT